MPRSRHSVPCPYRGLRPFEREDKDYFFGRSRDQKTIISNLYGSTLTVLYGTSGVGKTSLLLAGVVPELETNHRVAAVVFREWQTDNFQPLLRDRILQASLAAVNRRLKANKRPELTGVQQLSEAINEKLKREYAKRLELVENKRIATSSEEVALLSEPTVMMGPVLLEDRTLDLFMIECASSFGGRIFFILDQFEEYFLYHPTTEQAAKDFDSQFALAVNSPEIPVSFLVSLRDDGLSKLDRLKGRIPNLLGNMLRLEHLDRDGAREAIEKPLEKLNKECALSPDEQISIDPDLVEALLQVRPGLLDVQRGFKQGQSTTGLGESESRVAMPFLQLVLTRLWKEEIIEESQWRLTKTKFDALGGANEIVRQYLEGVMDRGLLSQIRKEYPNLGDDALEFEAKKVRSDSAKIFHYLVTAIGSKYAPTVSDLVDWIPLPQDRVIGTLELLGKLGVVRCVDAAVAGEARRYEVFHDVLAGAVRDWREDHEKREAEEKAKVDAEKEKAAAEKARLVAEKRAAEQHRQVIWTRWVACGFLVLFVFAVAALVWGIFANHARQEASRQAAWISFNQAGRLMQLGQWSEGVRHLAQAVKLDPQNTVVSERFFYELVINRAQARRVPIPGFRPEGEVFQVGFSPDGKRVLTASSNAATLWDAASGHRIRAFQHQGTVYQAGFNSDGGHVVTIGADKTAKLWDVNSEVPLHSFSHDNEVLQAAFGWNDERILTASTDGTAKLWNVKSGALIHSFSHRGPVLQAVFSPDGHRILTASADNTAKLWDANTGELLGSFQHSGSVLQAIFNSDGDRVLTTSADNTAKLWDANSGELINQFPHQSTQLQAIFSPDSQHILTTGADDTAYLWDANSGESSSSREVARKPVHSFHHDGKLLVAVFSPDSATVLTASEDNTARLWSVATGELIHSFQHAEKVLVAVFSPKDGKLILTGGADRTAKLWETKTGKLLGSFEHGDSVSAAIFSPDCQHVLTVSAHRTVKLWEANSREFRPAFQHQKKEVLTAAFSPDGRRVLTGSEDKTAILWDGESGAQLHRFPHLGRVSKIVFDRYGQKFLTVSSEKTAPDGVTSDKVTVWNANTFAPLSTLQSENGIAEFSPDDRFVLVATHGTVELWDTTSGKLGGSFACGAIVYDAAFDQDGDRLLTANADNVARLWDRKSGRLLRSLGHKGSVLHAVFSHNNRWILTASADRTVKLWDANTWVMRHSFPHDSYVTQAEFNRDGDRILTVSGDKTVSLWDSDQDSDRPLCAFQNTEKVSRAVFSPEGKRFLTASGDKTAKLWDGDSGRLLASFQHDSPVTDLVFSPDGGRILTMSGDNAELWDVDTPKLILEQASPHDFLNELEKMGESVTGAQLRPATLAFVDEIEALAEAVTGTKMSNDGTIEPIGDDRRRQLDDELRARLFTDNKGANGRFLHWFMCQENERTIFPSSNRLASHWDKKTELEQ